MTQKKDAIPASEKSSEHMESAAPDTAEEGGKGGGGFIWLLVVAAAIGGGIWAIEQGYVDTLLQETTDPVMTTETKPETPQGAALQRNTPTFDEPAPVAAKNEDISQLLRNQEASRKERTQLRENLTVLNAEMTALSESMQALVKSVEARKSEPATIAVTATAVDDTAVTALESRISELAARLDSLQQDYEQQSATHAVRLELLQSLAKVDERVTQGKSYADIMPRIQQLAARLQLRADALDTLTKQADISVSSLSQLIQDFSANAALALPYSINSSDSPTWSETLRSNVAHVISIRKVEVTADDNSDEAHIARAEAELRNGNVEMAITHLEQLSADPQALFSSWLQQAEHYLAMHDAIAELQAIVVQNKHEE